MTKELEALERIEKTTTNFVRTYNDEKQIWEDIALDNSCKPEIDLIRKALTPPTSEEVCKAIRGGGKTKVVCIGGDRFVEDDYPRDNVLLCSFAGGMIFFNPSFRPSPQTAIIIAKFYKSLEEKND